jgi:hypothetical protein
LGKTVTELEAAMTAEEFGEWQALYLIEPWGEYSLYLASGIVASTVANANRKPDTPPYRTIDFMPKFRQQEENVEEDPEEFLRKLSGGS